MANAANSVSDLGTEGDQTRPFLPSDPFRSLLVHFGMLLGVDDFETLDGYHRGKMWLHSAWLHREGTVWGLPVSVDTDAGEIRVGAGLAVDGLGRELYLGSDACLDVAGWYQAHKDDPGMAAAVTIDEDGSVKLSAHVVICFKPCLARQVPALSEPCDGAGKSVAYSRVVETVELLLLPGSAPAWRQPAGVLPYHRLRLLLGLEDPVLEGGNPVPEDNVVLLEAARIQSLPAAQQPREYLAAFRRFSALDEMAMTPATEGGNRSLLPASEPGCVGLADVHGMVLVPGDDAWTLSAAEVDNTIRPVHVPTSTIQELLCGPPCGCPTGEGQESVPVDAGGPRVESESVTLDGGTLRFRVTGANLRKASAQPGGVSVSSFQVGNGWHAEEISEVNYHAGRHEVTVSLVQPPTGNLVRLIVKGTGPAPFLGTNDVPLAGAVGGPPGGEFDGNDFVTMFRVEG